jgi:hypothetical protein
LLKLLPPDLPQPFQFGQLSQRRVGSDRLNMFQQVEAIGANLKG